MPHLDPSSVPIPDTAPDDPRFGHLLGQAIDDPLEADVVLIGFASDEGVRINGGRPGAAQAPDAIRRALYGMTPDARYHDAFVETLRRTLDLGDLVLEERLEENQEALGDALAPHLKRGAVPIILGGGHETAFGHFLGHVAAEQPVSILNWDAHADVRPLKDGRAHSGSPFRQALEHPSGRCQGYTVAGLRPNSTAKAHTDHVRDHGGEIVWSPDVTVDTADRLYAEMAMPHMVTFDLDAVDHAAAPGVSAPAVDGLSPRHWLRAAERAGRTPEVTSIDLVELNPTVDVDGRTARLAALTVWHMLRGLATRDA
jgi:formiminoglutamase